MPQERALPNPGSTVLVDPGEQPHQPRPPFGAEGLTLLHAHTGRDDPVGVFAHTVLTRGYPVEQETSIRAGLLATLGTPLT